MNKDGLPAGAGKDGPMPPIIGGLPNGIMPGPVDPMGLGPQGGGPMARALSALLPTMPLRSRGAGGWPAGLKPAMLHHWLC